MSALVVSRWDEQEMVQTLKQTVCKGASDSQFRMFVEICKVTGLNPLLKEIWFVPNVGIIAARDGYLRVANEHPQFDGMSTLVDRDDKNVPIKATCTVWRKDRNHPIICEAYYSEYRKSGNVWSTYPSAMISKVAEVLALKRSFSINGVVSEEEMGPVAANPDTAPHGQPAPQQGNLMIEPPRSARTEPAPPVDPTPPALMEMYKIIAGSDKYKKLDVFKEFRKSLMELTGSDEEYYKLLKRQGVEHSNQFKSTKPAQCAARDMYLAIQKAVTPTEIMPVVMSSRDFEASDSDLPANMQADMFGSKKEASYGTD